MKKALAGKGLPKSKVAGIAIFYQKGLLASEKAKSRVFLPSKKKKKNYCTPCRPVREYLEPLKKAVAGKGLAQSQVAGIAIFY